MSLRSHALETARKGVSNMGKAIWELRLSMDGAPPLTVSRSESVTESSSEATITVQRATPAVKGKKPTPGVATLAVPLSTGHEAFAILYSNSYAGGPIKYGAGKK